LVGLIIIQLQLLLVSIPFRISSLFSTTKLFLKNAIYLLSRDTGQNSQFCVQWHKRRYQQNTGQNSHLQLKYYRAPFALGTLP
jgi:hypothetical protein